MNWDELNQGEVWYHGYDGQAVVVLDHDEYDIHFGWHDDDGNWYTSFCTIEEFVESFDHESF